LLTAADLAGAGFPSERVDYGPVIAFKHHVLGRAWDNFKAGRAPALRPQLETFQHDNADWLDDFALFMAIKDGRGGGSWHDWPPALRQREPAAIARARKDLAEPIARHEFRQFLFARQWRDLKVYANERGVRVIGDMPIFVAADSADVWA